MTDIPKYYLADVPQDLRRHVLDLCFKRLWHDGLELLQQHGISHYTVDDLMKFDSWMRTHLPDPPAAAPTPADGGCVPQMGDQPQQPPGPAAAARPDPDTHQQQSILPMIPNQALLAPRTRNPEPQTSQQLAEARQQLLHLLSARAYSATGNGQLTTGNGQPATDYGQPRNPEPRTPNPEPATLLTDLRDVISRYVVLPEMAAETLALWIVHTYAFSLRHVTTYIGVLSPQKRCGKTTLLELLGLLAHEAVAAANISPSALFRVIEQKQPTLIIDEADTFLQRRDEMAGILNAGYRRGNAYVVRVAESKTRKDRLARYSCWCPKVMAAIGRLPDTLADRCIVITMQRKLPGEKCERLRELDATEYQQRCAEFVREHSDAIAHARPEIPSALNDRAADIWEPLFAIADLAGGEWPVLARHAAENLSASDDEITLLGHFLGDIRALMLNSTVDRVFSRDIIRVLNPRHDRPWEDLRRGREINEWWLGWQMRQLGIRPKYIRTGDITGRGYLLEDIESAFRRYLPNAEFNMGQASKTTQSADTPIPETYSPPNNVKTE